MAVSISISIHQDQRNFETNESQVTVSVTASWTYGSNNRTGQCTGSLTIDGTKHSFYGITFNEGQTTSGSQVIMTKTVDVSHNSDGSKTLACSASFVTGVSSGTVTASASQVLVAIPRKSSLSVGNGTLNTSQTLTVTRQSTNFTHSIKAVCGNSTLYIKADGSTSTTEVKHNDCSIPFTPPLSWASQNPNGESVSITYTITTYNGNTNLGSNPYTKTCSIPASVKPSVSLAVSDSMGYADTFGGYIQGQSKLKVVVTASGSYGSTIKSYKTTADGKTYTAASFTTSAIAGKDSLKISATVTDSRGRPATAEATVAVLAYSMPQISAFNCFRCDAEGVANPNGEYLAIVFDSTITPLNNKNSAAYELQYKKATADKYTTETLTAFAGQYSVSGGGFVFPADKSSSYNITLIATDNFTNATKTGTGASIKKWFSVLKSVFGFAIGKVAELGGVFDIALQTRFTGGILHPVLEPNADLDDVLIPNAYVGANISKYNYKNLPDGMTSGTFSLEVIGMGEEGQLKQRLTSCDMTGSRAWERIYHLKNNVMSWGDWVCVSDFDGQLLWEGAKYMHGTQSITLAEPVSKQRSGIVFVFSRYDGGAKDQDFHSFFVHKFMAKQFTKSGHNFIMMCETTNPLTRKYLYIREDIYIDGNAVNDQTHTSGGTTFKNDLFVLRYVIGV